MISVSVLGLGGAPPKSLSGSIGELISCKERVMGCGVAPDVGKTGDDSDPFGFAFGAILFNVGPKLLL